MLNWGLVSTGEMAGNFAEALRRAEHSRPLAVCSRSGDRASVFAGAHGIERAYHGLPALLDDDDIDVVYIASPHNAHYRQILAALAAGRHVVCEKPMVLNAAQAGRCAAAAAERSLFLMEAVWMRFLPAIVELRRFLETGGIGMPRLVCAGFCIRVDDAAHRLLNRSFAGGALLDLGLYPLSLAQMVLGPLSGVAGHAELGQDGIDVLDTLSVQSSRGGQASLNCGLQGFAPREATIVGSRGCVRIPEIFFRPDRLVVDYGTEKEQPRLFPFDGSGYIHEIRHVEECLGEGRLQSPVMPLDDTINVLSIMDSFRDICGIRYDEEDESLDQT